LGRDAEIASARDDVLRRAISDSAGAQRLTMLQNGV
jgi:hypothetical protein